MLCPWAYVTSKVKEISRGWMSRQTGLVWRWIPPTSFLLGRISYSRMGIDSDLLPTLWLDSPIRHLCDLPILIDSEFKKIQTLTACAGVHKHLISVTTLQWKR